MRKEALGLIETYGYVSAVVAADACLKSANVNLQKCEFVKGGLVTILITGDVSAVKAAVDAGEMAASRIGEVLSTSVIARTGEDLDEVFYKDKELDNCKAESSIAETKEESFKKEELEKEKLSDTKSKDSKKK